MRIDHRIRIDGFAADLCCRSAVVADAMVRIRRYWGVAMTRRTRHARDYILSVVRVGRMPFCCASLLPLS